MKIEECEKRMWVCSIYHQDSGMSLKETKNNTIDNVLSFLLKHYLMVYIGIENEMKNFESSMDWSATSKSVADKPRYNS